MASSATAPNVPLTFPRFQSLPLELRLQIWRLAAIGRPRTIQVTYKPENKTWHACKDGCGGLPTVVHVCREARSEALKPYDRAFDTYLDFDVDTIFVSDPIFTIRGPREKFLISDHVSKIKKFALYSEIYRGLSDSYDHFPKFCDTPPAVLRKLQSLEHFTLVVSPDGHDLDLESESDDFDIDVGEDDFEEMEGDAEIDTEVATGESTAIVPTAAEQRIDLIDKRLLDKLDSDAEASMTKGYFREVGDIHLGTPVNRLDVWENVCYYHNTIMHACWEEKKLHPSWVRPKITVNVVKFGLSPIDEPAEVYHDMGDHDEGITTYEEALEFLNSKDDTPIHEIELSMVNLMEIQDEFTQHEFLWKVVHAFRAISVQRKSFRLQQTAGVLLTRMCYLN